MTSAAVPAGGKLRELTLRGIILGAILTVIFTAANVYLGLRAGLTFATSIPAAVISMAVLKAFRDSTIQENNIVQTIASAAGTLSAIIFVLPGLGLLVLQGLQGVDQRLALGFRRAAQPPVAPGFVRERL